MRRTCWDVLVRTTGGWSGPAAESAGFCKQSNTGAAHEDTAGLQGLVILPLALSVGYETIMFEMNISFQCNINVIIRN